MFEWLRARRAAKRLGLRDRGRVGTRHIFNKESHFMQPVEICCERCMSRIRIGINKQGQAEEYCWRCESIIREPPPDDPHRIFFTFSMDEDVDSELKQLEAECRLERADLLYEALDIFGMCIEQVKLGNRVVIIDKNHTVVNVIDFGKWNYSGDDGWRREVEPEDPEE